MSEQLSLGIPGVVATLAAMNLIEERPFRTPTPGTDYGEKKHWIWSLKAGGRNVWLKKRIQVYAFHYLSSDRNCKEIEERPFSDGFPYEEIPWYRFVIGTRSFSGKECLWGVEVDTSLRPDGEGGLRPKNWHLVQEWCRKHDRHCGYVKESDIFEHRRLIENWRLLMRGVRCSHDDPNEALRDEIGALAEHPEGISIEQIVQLADTDVNETFNEICWLIHQNKLIVDLSCKVLSGQMIVRSTRVH